MHVGLNSCCITKSTNAPLSLSDCGVESVAPSPRRLTTMGDRRADQVVSFTGELRPWRAGHGNRAAAARSVCRGRGFAAVGAEFRLSLTDRAPGGGGGGGGTGRGWADRLVLVLLPGAINIGKTHGTRELLMMSMKHNAVGQSIPRGGLYWLTDALRENIVDGLHTTLMKRKH